VCSRRGAIQIHVYLYLTFTYVHAKGTPLWECCKAFVCIAKRSVDEFIYSLFLQPVVGFWGIGPRTYTEAPSLDPPGGLSSPFPKLATSGKNPAGVHDS